MLTLLAKSILPHPQDRRAASRGPRPEPRAAGSRAAADHLRSAVHRAPRLQAPDAYVFTDVSDALGAADDAAARKDRL